MASGNWHLAIAYREESGIQGIRRKDLRQNTGKNPVTSGNDDMTYMKQHGP